MPTPLQTLRPRCSGVSREEIDEDADYEAVKQDLEEDPELRRGVNLYRAEEQAVATADDDEEEDEDAPEVPLAELLEGLVLQDAAPAPMATG